MEVIYIAGKYRGTTEREVFNNIIIAREAAIMLWDEGWAVICPHANSMLMGTGEDDEKYLAGDIEILKRCDAVYMLKDWEKSEGAKKELDLAHSLGKEIYFDV